MKTVETDLLIVGGGVAGSALACALRDSGYWVVLVEQRTGRLDTARGDHLQPCTVDALARWGVLPRFYERGAGRRLGHEFRSQTGESLLRADYSELPIPHPYFLVYDHDLISETFLDLASEGSNFDLFRPAVARDFKVVEGRIRSLKIRADGEDVLIKPHIVVGADGSNSIVRSALDFATFEHAYHHPVVVLLSPRPTRLVPDNYFFRYSGPDGVLGIHQRMDGQIKITLPIGAEGIPWWKKSSKEDRACALGRRADILKGCDSTVAGFYAARMIRAVDNVSGNVVLVGDAAHSIHPARGQGLNMGIANLQQLIDCLPDVAEVSRAEKVRQALLHYQGQLRPLLDRTINRHHQAATEMDVDMGAGTEGAALICKHNQKIREINARPELRRMHLLEVTGYPFGAPSEAEPDYLA
ncbi:MAG: FAD-dependent monooxygenase [Vicinamibacteria bacterium]|nr:FAD-dependent monooxygenase [Vicinamibacteria bacterium]